MRKQQPRRGDWVLIEWVDIYEDPTGNPDEAKLQRRPTSGQFWEKRKDGDVDVLVTTNTMDRGDHHQQGYCIYPMGCIVSIEIIKRAPRARPNRRKA